MQIPLTLMNQGKGRECDLGKEIEMKHTNIIGTWNYGHAKLVGAPTCC